MHCFEEKADKMAAEKNWLEKLNDVLTYVEKNLTDKVDYESAAQLACLSGYRFQRVFSFVADIPFGEYIRRRRMTLAAFDLQNSNMKVIDIALKYGYESPEAFTRAFQSIHSVTPTMARGSGIKLKAYPKISFQISIKGDVEMDYRIEKGNAFLMKGVEREFDSADETCFSEIPQFWKMLCAEGQFDKMAAAVQAECTCGQSHAVRACSYQSSGNGTKFLYMIGVVNEEQGILPGYHTMKIEAGTWAVFTSEVCRVQEISSAMQKVIKQIFTEWLPTSKYKAGKYQQELHYITDDGKVYCEVWQMIEDAG